MYNQSNQPPNPPNPPISIAISIMNQYIASTILCVLLVVSYAHGKSQELNPTTFANTLTSKNR